MSGRGKLGHPCANVRILTAVQGRQHLLESLAVGDLGISLNDQSTITT